jgi:hypothetical protein
MSYWEVGIENTYTHPEARRRHDFTYHLEVLNTDLQSSCMTLRDPGKQCTSTHMATSRGYAPSDLAVRRVGDILQAIERFCKHAPHPLSSSIGQVRDRHFHDLPNSPRSTHDSE